MIDNKGHPHAELALQYWTEAKDDAEPWRNWEFKNPGYKWSECDETPRFLWHVEYRRKPKIKLIHGFEVPDISFMPVAGEHYLYPCPSSPALFGITHFSKASNVDGYRLRLNGFVYPHTEEGKAAAIKHALAMLGYNNIEEMEAALAAKEGDK